MPTVAQQTPEVVRILRATRHLLSDESRLCKHSGALTAEGAICDVGSPNAASWSLSWAVIRSNDITGEHWLYGCYAIGMIRMAVEKLIPEYEREEDEMRSEIVRYFNDHPTTSHADILKAIDLAIDMCDETPAKERATLPDRRATIR